MRQVAILLSLIAVILCESAFAFRATVEGITLEIPVPLGWHKASYTEQMGLEMGIQEEENQQKLYPAIIKGNPSEDTKWVIAVGVLPDVSENEATIKDLESIGIELKKNSVNNQLVTSDNDEYGMKMLGQVKQYVEEDNFVALELNAKSSFAEKELFKSTATSYWALNGFILINRHIYCFNAVLGNGTPSQKFAFCKFAKEWLKELTDANHYTLRPAEKDDEAAELRKKPVPDKFDQWNAGDVDGNNRSLLKMSLVRDLQDGEWKKLDLSTSSRFENLMISVQYPGKLKLEKVPRGNMIFKFSSHMADDRIFYQMDVSSQPMTKDTELLFEMINKDKVEDDLIESSLSKTAPNTGRIIGFGPTSVNGHNSLWYTTLISETRFGLRIIAIERTYKIPMSRGVLLTMKFAVASVNTSFAPVNEFLDLLPTGIRFVGSVHEDNPAALSGSQIPKNAKGSGTGWFVNKNHVVTCWHVISDASAISFQTIEGTTVKLVLVDKDITSDIAVLKVLDQKFFCSKPLQLSSSPPTIAENVCTVGYPIPELMGQEPKYTVGVISALSGIMGDNGIMQISTPVQPGNSGGALLNDAGEVVGIVQSRLKEGIAGMMSGSSPQNVNYAIKLDPVRKLLSQDGIDYVTQSDKLKLSRQQIYNRAKDATVFILAQ